MRRPKLRACATAVLALGLGALDVNEIADPWPRSDREIIRAACEARGERDELLLVGMKSWITQMEYFGSPPYRVIVFNPVETRAPNSSYEQPLEELASFRPAEATESVLVMVEPATLRMLREKDVNWKTLLPRDRRFGPFRHETTIRGVQLWRRDRR